MNNYSETLSTKDTLGAIEMEPFCFSLEVGHCLEVVIIAASMS